MESKECPLQPRPLLNEGLACNRDRCAWWMKEKGRCAVAVIAKSLLEIYEVYELDRATSIGSDDDG